MVLCPYHLLHVYLYRVAQAFDMRLSLIHCPILCIEHRTEHLMRTQIWI